MATLLLLGNYAVYTIEALGKDAVKATYIEAEMLMLRRHEKDFLARKNPKYQDKFNATLQETLTNIDVLQQDLAGHGIDISTLTEMKPLFQQYGDKFNQLVGLQKQIGLHSKDGYYGTLRAAVHQAESHIKALNDYQLLAGMLQLRRNEKDFMLRLDTKYVNKHTANLSMLLDQVDTSAHPKSDKASLSKALDQYKFDFLELVALEKKLGLSPKKGLLGELRGVIHQTEELLNKTKESIANAVIDHTGRTDTIFFTVSALLAVLNISLIVWIALGIIHPVEKLSKVMSQASQNRDLTQRVDIQGKDEIANIAAVFNTMLGEFRKLIAQLVDSSNQLSTSAQQMSIVTNNTSQNVMRQRSESDQVATAIHEMSSTVHEVAQNANEAASASRTADEQAGKGRQVVSSAINSINKLVDQITDTATVIKELESESHNISTVLDVIREIAEQTNLLALNAAIEAARAGEQGRGFAVVADEVRALAQRSQDATQEINKIITRLQEKSASATAAMENGLKQTESNVNLAQEAGAALSEITAAVAAINDMNIQIASAAEEQSSVSEEINRNVVNITQIANETAEGAEETTNTSHVLTDMANQLRGIISQFKVQ